MDIKALEDEMKSKDISINKLAELSGVDKSTISRILKGERNCSISTAQLLSKALKLSSRKATRIFFGQ